MKENKKRERKGRHTTNRKKEKKKYDKDNGTS